MPKPRLTETLAALAGHYTNHPELPAWHAIDVIDGTIRLHTTIGDIDEPTATGLLAWADSLDQPQLRLQRYKGGPGGLVYDRLNIHANIGGQHIVIHRELPGFGAYIGAPTVDKLGQSVVIPVTVDQLRAFHGEGLDYFGLVA